MSGANTTADAGRRDRYGLIGCGDIGRLRAAAIARSGGTLVSLSDLDPRRASQLGNRYGALVDRDWHTLLERDDLDAVIVSTPPSLHAEMCVAALRAGKHVLCEKPLARSPAESRTMVDAARETSRTLVTGFNYRFYPSFALARELLDSGIIGELSHISAYGGYSATGHNQPWVHDGEVVGGGALHDIGIHLIDLTRWYLGEVEEVEGAASGSVWNFPRCEDNGFLLLRSAHGRIATVHASWTEWGRYRFMIELVGAHGRIRTSCFPMMTEVLWSDRPGGRMRRRRHAFRRVMVGEHLRSYRWVVTRSFIRELEAFARTIAGERTAVASGWDGMRALEIAYAGSHAISREQPAPADALR